MKCSRTSVDNEWRNMGGRWANMGRKLEDQAGAIKAPYRALFIEGYEAHMAKRARAALRALKQLGA